MLQFLRSPALLALMLCASFGGGRVEIQDPPRGRTEVLSEAGRVRLEMVEAYGGAELLDGIAGFKFRLIPSEFVLQEDGSYLEKVSEPLGVEIDYHTGQRRVRIEDRVDGQSLVRLISPSSDKAFLAGQPVDLPEMLAVGRQQAAQLMQFLDLFYALPSGRIPSTDDRRRTRDGLEYQCFEAVAAGGRSVRYFINLSTFLVERCDLFDLDLRRSGTFTYGRVERFGKLPVPMRHEVFDRERLPLIAWTLEAVELNPEFPAGRFENP